MFRLYHFCILRQAKRQKKRRFTRLCGLSRSIFVLKTLQKEDFLCYIAILYKPGFAAV